MLAIIALLIPLATLPAMLGKPWRVGRTAIAGSARLDPFAKPPTRYPLAGC
jgi:hypothetical protein